MSERIRDVLEDFEVSGGDLYWTDKQRRVIREILQNPNDTRSEIASHVGCHQSYVNYVLENASPDIIRELRRKIEEGEKSGVEAVVEGSSGDEDEFTRSGIAEVEEIGDNQKQAAVGGFDDIEFAADDAAIEDIEFSEAYVTITVKQMVPVKGSFKLPRHLFQKSIDEDDGEENSGNPTSDDEKTRVSQ